MRVLVCGGRDYEDVEKVYSTLDAIHKEHLIDVIIEGDAKGADRMAGYWARKNRVDLKIFKANWELYGNSAGIIRNKQMLKEGRPDLVVAFSGGKGTQNMVMQANKANIDIYFADSMDAI